MPSHLPFESKGSFGSPSRRGPIFRLSILILFVGLCLSSRSARADFSGRYFINATFQCPYYLRGDGEWDLEFRPENRQFKPCYGLHVVAKQPGTFGDSYCGEDYTAADGSVRIRASTDCDGDVFLSVEASSLQGFRVGTHDFPWWRAPLDAWLAYVTVGLAIPGEVYDFLVANKTFEWDSPSMSVHAGTGDRVDFGTFAVGTTNVDWPRQLDTPDHNSAMAADLFPLVSAAMSQLQNSGHLPADLAITINQPVFGTPTTVWDTVLFKDANARDPNQYRHMIRSLAHEIGHATYNRYHSGRGHWLTDARYYLANHYQCEPVGTLRFAWYEGFADFVESYVYPGALRQRGGLELTEHPNDDPYYHVFRGCYWDHHGLNSLAQSIIRPVDEHNSAACTTGASGFNHEGNVQAMLDQVYYGPYRRAYPSNWDSSPPIPGTRARDPHRAGRGQLALVSSADRSMRAFSLPPISDVFAWIEAAGGDSHTAREFLDRQIGPWCANRDIADRYCTSVTFQNEMRYLDASSSIPDGCPPLDPASETSGTPISTNVQLRFLDSQSNPVTAIHFGVLAPGETRQSTVNLVNSGSDPITVDWLAFAGDQAVSLVNPPPLPIQLAPNARTAVTVAFSPRMGSYSSTLFASSSLIEGLSLPGGSASVVVDGSAAATLCERVSVSTIAGTGQSGRMDGPASTATFTGPAGIALAPNGDVFLADDLYPAIRRISVSGTVSTFSTTVGNSPVGIAIDATGRLYVSGISDCRIYSVDSTGMSTLLAGSSCGFQDGTGPNARFQYPFGIAVHANGTVYVADAGNRRVRAITPAGVTTTLAGSGANGSADGVGTAASFGQPSGLALLGNTLYVTDYTNNSIRQIDVTTGAVTTRLPASVLGAQGLPAAIVADNLGNLIFMTHGGDTLNLLPAGSSSVERLAGATSRVPNQFADGNGCDARFDDIEGLALSGRRLVMSDHYNLRARQATLP